ncbi:MAG: PEP-utilizing enzyme [Nanoarchaeota archaeon]
MPVLKGQIANPGGLISGIVSVILDINNLYEFEEGNILVIPMTTPECTHIMKKSSAIITERGGISCHAAIVSRELSKPCVVGVEGITNKVKNGKRITLNADRGEVYLE